MRSLGATGFVSGAAMASGDCASTVVAPAATPAIWRNRRRVGCASLDMGASFERSSVEP